MALDFTALLAAVEVEKTAATDLAAKSATAAAQAALVTAAQNSVVTAQANAAQSITDKTASETAFDVAQKGVDDAIAALRLQAESNPQIA